MAHRKSLTEDQLRVLRWISDGCPEGVMAGYAHRVSAAALRRRDLVRTAGKGPSWQAAITQAGRDYISHAESPDAPRPRQANKSVTQQLVDDVVAAGGALRLPRKQYLDPDGVDYRRRALLAEQYGKVPTGKQLVVRSVSPDEIEIAQIEADGGTAIPLQPVPVPEHVARYHPAVAELRARSGYYEVSREALPRVSRILQGLTLEAERRGHRVEAVSAEKSNRHGEGWTGPNDGHLVITANDYPTAIRVHEEGLPSRVHWESQSRSYGRYPFEGGPKLPPLTEYEAGATGRITFAIAPAYSSHGRPAQWADRKSWTLEEKLPELPREVEVRAAEDKERRQRAEEEAQRRKRDWEAAMERAHKRLAEARKADVLRGDVSRWREVEEIRAYCDAVERAHAEDAGARDWVAWGRAYADRIDPLAKPARAPDPPESVSAEELRPHLDGWSPFGPERGRW